MPKVNNPKADYLVYTNSVVGVNTGDVLFTTNDVARFDTFELMTTAGNADVLVSIDDINFSTVAMAIEDQGATTSTTFVTATAATGRIYKLRGKFARIRVRQNGATGATAILRCGAS